MFSMLSSSEMFPIFHTSLGNGRSTTETHEPSASIGMDGSCCLEAGGVSLLEPGERVVVSPESTIINDLELNHHISDGSDIFSNHSPTSSSVTSNDGSIWSDEDREDEDIANILSLNCTDLNYFNENILFSANDTDLVEEVVSHHSNPVPPKAKRESVALVRDPKSKLYHCPHCDKAFQYSSRLQRHLTAHQAKQFHCQICDKHFSRQDVLSTHLSKVHQMTKQSLMSPSPLPNAMKLSEFHPCHLCDAKLSSKFHLKRHLRSHDNRVGAFMCSYCGKGFDVKHKFQRHLRLHVGERKFKCHLCDMGFLQNEFLARHLLTHSGENPFKCTSCGKAFNQLINLKQHVERLHSADQGKKAHQCQECEKSFFTLGELRNHQLYHDNARMFPCSTCDSSFVEKRHLDRHIRRMHSKIKNYFCNTCAKAFYERYELNHHKKSCHPVQA